MIRIEFQEPDTEDWNNWKEECEEARSNLIVEVDNGNPPVINNSLYKAQKSVFFENTKNFFGKCAYCETKITTNQPGDIEHYRPKGRVTDSQNKPITIKDKNNIDIPHPGYYWLAYDFHNLLPSCIDCNRPSSGNSGGVLVGKWDQFPVNNFRALVPNDEVKESPLIINPVEVDPEDHIAIDEVGVLHPKTPQGDNTIKILGLNFRTALIDERVNVYERVKEKALLLILACLHNQNPRPLFDVIEEYKRGERPYSLAGRKGLADFLKENTAIRNFFNQ